MAAEPSKPKRRSRRGTHTHRVQISENGYIELGLSVNLFEISTEKSKQIGELIDSVKALAMKEEDAK